MYVGASALWWRSVILLLSIQWSPDIDGEPETTVDDDGDRKDIPPSDYDVVLIPIARLKHSKAVEAHGPPAELFKRRR